MTETRFVHIEAVARQRFLNMVVKARIEYSENHGAPAENDDTVWINDLFFMDYEDLMDYFKNHSYKNAIMIGNATLLFDRIEKIEIFRY